MLDLEISRRFTMKGRQIADGIELDAGWATADRLAIRAEDEDAVCEMTERVARRLREQLGAIRTKIAPKLSSWVSRRRTQVEKLGLKALSIARLRAWPDEVTSKVDPEEKNAGEPYLRSEESSEHDEVPSDYTSASETTDSSVEAPAGTGNHLSTDALLDNGSSAASQINRDDRDEHHFHDDGDGDDDDRGRDRTGQPRRYRGHRNYTIADGTRSRSSEHNPDKRQTNTPPPPQSGERMRSYVEHSLDRRERERQRNEARESGDATEKFVVEKEIEAGRDAQRLGGNHPGYDITSKSKDGTDERYIEVKSVAGEWGGAGVRLTPTQFAYAERLGEKYWLYVVENAKTDTPVIHAIQNPAAHISAFCFDCGWRDIAEVATKENLPSLFIPKVGDTVIFDEQEVVVEKVETRGAFVLVTFKLDGRTYRKMNTALLPKE